MSQRMLENGKWVYMKPASYEECPIVNRESLSRRKDSFITNVVHLGYSDQGR